MNYNTFVVVENKDIYAFGSNTYGECGVGNLSSTILPTKVKLENFQIKKISNGYEQTFFLSENGELWACGNQSFIGISKDTYEKQHTPIEIPYFKNINVVQVCTGDTHTLVVCSQKKLYGFGSNYYGELGIGNYTQQNIPLIIPFFKNIKVKKICTGFNHSFVLTENDVLYAFGSNSGYKLGVSNFYNKESEPNPVRVTYFDDMKIKEIHAGSSMSFVILEIGDIYSFGNNKTGELGLDHTIQYTTPQKITFFKNKQVETLVNGFNHTFVRLKSGEYYGFGDNFNHQLPTSNERHIIKPYEIILHERIESIMAFGNHTIFMFKNTCYGIGSNHFGEIGNENRSKINFTSEISFFRENNLKFFNFKTPKFIEILSRNIKIHNLYDIYVYFE